MDVLNIELGCTVIKTETDEVKAEEEAGNNGDADKRNAYRGGGVSFLHESFQY